jgi:nucleotide-binding universal stress UspA family protein
MKKIMISTDFSENGKNALQYGFELARSVGAEILIFHGYHVPILAGESYLNLEMDVEYAVENKTMFENYIEETKKYYGNSIPIKGFTQDGFDTDSIESIIDKNKIDLVIIGAHGSSGLTGSFMGSNALRLISNLTCPVLVIPKGVVFTSINKIIYATNFQFDDLLALESLILFLKPFKPEITVTNICTNNNDLMKFEEQIEWFKNIAGARLNYPKMVFEIIKNESVLNGLMNDVNAKKIDLIAMSTISKNIFEKVFHSSLVKKISSQTRIPLLVYHLDENNLLN